MKGILIAAGYGTRCLPATKTVPKELLPVGCVPAIQFLVDELQKSGITELIVVSSRRKKALEDYFDREIELESVLTADGKTEALEKIAPPPVRVVFVRQERMMGTGHALLQVKDLVGDEPCVVAYPDDLHIGEPPLALQLIREYEKTGCSVLASVLWLFGRFVVAVMYVDALLRDCERQSASARNYYGISRNHVALGHCLGRLGNFGCPHRRGQNLSHQGRNFKQIGQYK